jgi:hypothetical protein
MHGPENEMGAAAQGLASGARVLMQDPGTEVLAG